MTIDEWLDEHLEIYVTCPTNYEDARRVTRMYIGKQARFTVAELLSVLRHHKTNYNWIHPLAKGIFTHEEVRDNVNQRLLDYIGLTIKEGE